MGIRTLLTGLLLLAIGYIIVSFARRRRLRRPPTSGVAADSLVRCTVCDTFIPRGNAIERDGNYQCSGKHQGH